MNDEFIITPGPAPDSALNPLRANLSRLALSDEVSDEDREAIKNTSKIYKAMNQIKRFHRTRKEALAYIQQLGPGYNNLKAYKTPSGKFWVGSEFEWLNK